jgi:hypothetical protein
MAQNDDNAGPRSGRRSRSMDASKRAERERLAKMTPMERIELALKLGRRAAGLRALRASRSGDA